MEKRGERQGKKGGKEQYKNGHFSYFPVFGLQDLNSCNWAFILLQFQKHILTLKRSVELLSVVTIPFHCLVTIWGQYIEKPSQLLEEVG